MKDKKKKVKKVHDYKHEYAEYMAGKKK